MSRSRQKGTAGENYFLARLRPLFYPTYVGDVELHPLQRSSLKGSLDYGDFTGVPWLHESKHTLRPNFQAWARLAEQKANGRDWVICWKGDLRRGAGHGPYCLLPFEMYERLVRGAP